MTPSRANRPPSLLDYLEGSIIRELPPWIRRFLSHCHPKRVIRVPAPLCGAEIRDRDQTIRTEHWCNRREGLTWKDSVDLLSARHGMSPATVARIIRNKKLTQSSNSTS